MWPLHESTEQQSIIHGHTSAHQAAPGPPLVTTFSRVVTTFSRVVTTFSRVGHYLFENHRPAGVFVADKPLSACATQGIEVPLPSPAPPHPQR